MIVMRLESVHATVSLGQAGREGKQITISTVCIVGAPELTLELLLPLLDWSCQSCSAHVCVIPTTNTYAACSDEQAQTYVYAYSQGHSESHACTNSQTYSHPHYGMAEDVTWYKIATSFFLNFFCALAHASANIQTHHSIICISDFQSVWIINSQNKEMITYQGLGHTRHGSEHTYIIWQTNKKILFFVCCFKGRIIYLSPTFIWLQNTTFIHFQKVPSRKAAMQ